MLFVNVLSNTTQRYILQQPEGALKNTRIDEIRKAVDELVKLEIGSKPIKMDISAMYEQPQEDEWSEAQWNSWWYSGGTEAEEQAEVPDDQNTPSLDALGKGKGKGGNEKGKGKGWGWQIKGGKAKGKGKGWQAGDSGKGWQGQDNG